MGDLRDYNDLPKECGLNQDTPTIPYVREPKTITQLIAENRLDFPFVIRKLTDYNNSMGGLLMQAGIILTVTHKYPNNKTSYGEKNMGTFYSCYYEQNQFDILDTPSWVLVEKSDKNVLSLNAYRKFKESKKVRMR